MRHLRYPCFRVSVCPSVCANCLFQGNLCLNYSHKYKSAAAISAKSKSPSCWLPSWLRWNMGEGFMWKGGKAATRVMENRTNVSITWRYYCESHLNIARWSLISQRCSWFWLRDDVTYPSTNAKSLGYRRMTPHWSVSIFDYFLFFLFYTSRKCPNSCVNSLSFILQEISQKFENWEHCS